MGCSTSTSVVRAGKVERPAALGRLEITVTPRDPLTPKGAAEFAALGVDRLVVIPDPHDEDVRSTIDAALATVAGE